MSWTAPRTWVAGESVTAALLNTHIRDNLLAFGGPWTTYTPTWTSSGVAPSIGDGTLTGRYAEAGKSILLFFEWVAGSTTTYGSGAWYFALPKTRLKPAGGTDYVGLAGWVNVVDISAGRHYWLTARTHPDSTRHDFVGDDAGTNGGILSQATSTFPHTWAAGDTMRGYLMYEAA